MTYIYIHTHRCATIDFFILKIVQFKDKINEYADVCI